MLDFIGFVVVGGLAGWVAGKIMTGKGYGPLLDVMLGIAGGILGGWIIGALLGTLGGSRPGGLLAEFFVSLVGGAVLVAILHLVTRDPLRS
jgi:uncharacterized membrane protein YeaQ/YmgE (transglycosylase-associated protein family)